MIFIIDIVILGFIAYFSITRSLRSDPLTEVSKLSSIMLALLGAMYICPELFQDIVLKVSSSLLLLNLSALTSNLSQS